MLRQVNVGVQEHGRHSPGHGSAPGPLALWNAAVGFAQNVRCLVCGCLWSAHTGTRLVTAVPLGRWHCWNAAVGFAQYVRCLVCVCVPMVGAHRHSPGHGSALGPLALLECGGQLRTVCALLGVSVCLWLAHTGTRLVTAVPLGRWHCWNAAVSIAPYVRCMECVCVPMVGAHRHSPGHGSALGPLALLECSGRLRTVCALLGVCVCLW